MSPERLAEIEARILAATPGPWSEDYMWGRCVNAGSVTLLRRDTESPQLTNGDITLIAHAPGDITALLSEVSRLTARLADTEAGLAQSHATVVSLRVQLLNARQRCDVDNDHDADNDGEDCGGTPDDS